MSAYQKLEQRFARIDALGQSAAVLHWDMATMMPSGGAPARSEQLSTLGVLSHEMLTAAEVGDWLTEAEQQSALNDWQQANLREMRRDYRNATALPADLVEARTKAGHACEMVWRTARPASDFAAVKPLLAEVLNLQKQAAALLGAQKDCSPYDALIDQFEPEGSTAVFDPVFEDYAAFLPDFLSDVLDHQAKQPAAEVPAGPFTTADQKALGEAMMGVLGFDFDHGRLDVSAHPFCGGTPSDVRMTTRYDESDFTTALMGVLHETGHALYELGLPADWRAQPAGKARGMTMHESQSLLMEMQACRGDAFLSFLAPKAAAQFGGSGAVWSAENMSRIYRKVEPGFIRVDADEVTYPAHVILRYRLEKALFADELQVADLPGAWNDCLQSLLGIRPPADRLGVLQDIHWYDGAFGYFPTYSLGAMAAAQIFAAAGRALPDLDGQLARGDFSALLGWLRTNIHGQASRMSTNDILTAATGSPLDPAQFKAHLKRRYLG